MGKSRELSFRASDLPPKVRAVLRKHREELEQCLTKKQSASLKLGPGHEIGVAIANGQKTSNFRSQQRC